jgi:tetrahydromethanopterin S-methyltransferase subunit G
MEKNYWQIDDNLYKVYISADVYNELEQDFKIDEAAKYIKDGDIIAYDIMVDENKLKKVLKRLEEFDC